MSRDANPVPLRLTAPRPSHPSDRQPPRLTETRSVLSQVRIQNCETLARVAPHSLRHRQSRGQLAHQRRLCLHAEIRVVRIVAPERILRALRTLAASRSDEQQFEPRPLPRRREQPVSERNYSRVEDHSGQNEISSSSKGGLWPSSCRSLDTNACPQNRYHGCNR